MLRLVPPCIFLLCPVVAVAEVWVPTRVVRAGEVISFRDLEIRPDTVAGAVTKIEELVGLEALVSLYPGRPVRPDQVGRPTVIARNQKVLITYASDGLRIEAEGRALDRGGLGDAVRVMNLASRRTVVGNVRLDGSILVGGSK